jgi:spermidine synthase
MESVAVLEHFDGNRSLLVNNRFAMGGTGSALAERRHASLPLLLHPEPKRALFLGLGTGITFAGAGPHAGLSAEAVELVPEIVQVLPWFQPQNVLPADPGRFQIHVADARRFVQATPRQYDIIVADLFHPAKDGAGALYALEHYRAIRRRTAVGGLVCQWLPLFQLDAAMLRAITRTFLDVFPDGHAFLLRFNIDTPVLGLIAGLRTQQFGPDYFFNRVRDPALADQLKAEQIRDGHHLFGCYLAGPHRLASLCSGAALNTDNQPVVLFGAPQVNLTGVQRPYDLLLWLIERCPPQAAELFPGATGERAVFSEQLAGFMAARNVYLRGLVAEAEQRESEAIDSFVESARVSRFFTTGYAHALSLAMQKSKTQPEQARRILQSLAVAQPDRPVAAELLKRLSL